MTSDPIFKPLSRKFSYASLLLLNFFLFIACSNDDDQAGEFDFPLEGNTYSISDISGDWNALFASFQEVGNPGNGFEVLEQGGMFTLSINNNGRFSAFISVPGEPSETFSGQLGFDGDSLVLLEDGDEAGDEAYFSIDIDTDGSLFLDGIVEFDLDGNGSFENTNLTLVLVRT